MKTAYYKYRPLYQFGRSGNLEPHPFTESILTNAALYYSAPKDFNDPYDCNLKLHVADSTDAEWIAYLDGLIATNPGNRASLDVVKAQQLWKTDPRLSQDVGRDNLRINYEESSVLCFVKISNSIPMFSYYSDNHRGIAIEFQFSDDEVPCGIPFANRNARGVPYEGKITFRDVEYPPTFPEMNYHRIRGSDQLVRTLIFTKHYEWVHEKEFRIFRRAVTASTVQFEKRLLTRVIFGCRTTQADVNLVKGWLTGWGTDVVLSNAVPANDRFELVVTDFDVVK